LINKIKSIYNEIYEFGQMGKRSHLDSHSAAAAFFMFVSIIPTIILIIALIPYTPLTADGILEALELVLPDRLDSYAVDIVKQLTNRSITLVSVSAIVALWSAARGVLTIKQGINEIHGVTETRNFLILRINAAFYTLILIVCFIAMVIIQVVFTALERYFREAFGISITAQYDFLYIFNMLRPIISLVLGFLGNLYFFTVVPNAKVSVKGQVPGAILVSLVWYLYSAIFAIYINYFNAFSMYGSLSVVIIILMWLYACMYIMFMGAQLNYYLSLKKENNKI